MRRKIASCMVAAAALAAGMVGVTASPADAAPVSDSFNRADSTDLGAGWVEPGIPDLQISAGQVTNPNASIGFAQAVGGTGETVTADVSAGPAGVSQFAALAVNVDAGADMVFVKVQDTDANGLFDEIVGMRALNAGTPIFEQFVAEFAAGHLTVASDGHNVSAAVETDGDPMPEVFVSGPAWADATGDGVGISAANGSRLDNFSSFDGTESTSIAVTDASPSPSTPGQAVTFTAVATPAAGATQPTGSAIFAIDGVDQAPIALSSGQAQLTTSALAVGDHSVSVRYVPDSTAFFPSASSAITHTVGLASTTATLTSDVNPSAAGQTVAFTATVTATAGGGMPDGTVTFTVDGVPGAPVVLASGQATLVRNDLAVGSHSVTATYSGSATYQGSTSNTLTQVVDSIDTTATIVSNHNPSTVGENVTFTATITSGTGPVSAGTVSFTDGATPLASSVALAADGTAQLTVNTLTAGSHTITASYSGTSSYAASSANVTQQVDTATSATAVTASPTPSVVGQAVTFTATVSGGSSTPTGTATFKEGSTTLGTVALASGEASLTTSSLPAGPHTITVEYGGDAAHDPSTGGVTHTVAQAGTTSSITSSADPSTVGNDVTFEITVAPVAPGAGTPTGSVAVSVDGGSPTNVALSAGVATMTLPFDTVGTFPVAATYSGDGSFTGSGTSIDQHVVKAASTTTLTSSDADDATTFGETVTFTATVTGAPSTPTGTATFKDGTTTLGTVALVAGVADLTTSALPVGSHAITVEYGGDATHDPSTDGSTHTVTKAGTSSSIVTSADPASAGDDVTFEITVAPVAPGAGTPTGSVAVSVDGGTPTNVALSSGVATLTVPFDTVGTFPVTATYGGDASFTGSSGSFDQEVVKAASTTTLTSSDPDGQTTYGETVTFTATTDVGGAAPADGTIELFDGAVSLGTAAASGSPVTFEVAGLSAGGHDLTATYSGSAAAEASTSAALSLSVAPLETTLTVVDRGGMDIEVSVAALSGSPKARTRVAAGPAVAGPTGTIRVVANGGQVGHATLGPDGTVVMTLDGLVPGTNVLQLFYSGDHDHAGSSTTFTKVVEDTTPPPPTTTTSTPTTTTAPTTPGVSGGALARTGADPGPSVLSGLLLALTGVAMVALSARRRRLG